MTAGTTARSAVNITQEESRLKRASKLEVGETPLSVEAFPSPLLSSLVFLIHGISELGAFGHCIDLAVTPAPIDTPNRHPRVVLLFPVLSSKFQQLLSWKYQLISHVRSLF